MAMRAITGSVHGDTSVVKQQRHSPSRRDVQSAVDRGAAIVIPKRRRTTFEIIVQINMNAKKFRSPIRRSK
jgi:hypothetical protein